MRRMNSEYHKEQQLQELSRTPALIQRIVAMHALMLHHPAPTDSSPTTPPFTCQPSPHPSPLIPPHLDLDQSQPFLTPFLTFSDPSIEPSYQADYVRKYFPTLWLAVLMSTSIWILFVATDVYKLLNDKRLHFWQTVTMRFGVALVVLIPTWSTMLDSVRQRVTAHVMKAALFTYLLLFAACQLGFGLLQDQLLDPTYCDFIILVASMSATTFRLPCFLSMACNTLMCLLVILFAVAVPNADADISQDDISQESTVEAIVWIVIAIVLFSFHGYSVEYSMRSTFLSAQQLSEQESRSQSVLATMLPQRVISELRTAQGSFVYSNYTDVSVLFSHVHQFDQHTSSLEPRYVVELLNNLFSRFDTLTDQLNVYKVETIGDVYLVSGGVPEKMEHHACVLSLLAIAMQEEMRLLSLSLQHGAPLNLQLRIGLHSGPVIAGVVGQKYPRYRLMGDTVNTASRMSTTCQPSQIQMTRATFMQLSEQFVCRFNGSRPIKGKGPMDTYMLKYVLPVPGSNMLPVSTAEALGRKTAVQVAEKLGCPIPTNILLRQHSSVGSTTTSRPLITYPARALTAPAQSASSAPSVTRSIQPHLHFHARPLPGLLYSNAVVDPATSWNADDVGAVLAESEAGRTVHLLRRTKQQRQQEQKEHKTEVEEPHGSQQPTVQRHDATSYSSNSMAHEQAHHKRDSGSGSDLLPDTTGNTFSSFSSSVDTVSHITTTTTTHTRILAAGVSGRPAPSAPPLNNGLSLASNFTSRAASSSSTSSIPSPASPSSPISPIDIVISTAPGSPSILPLYSPRPSDLYTISATTVSVSFLRTVPSFDELQQPNPLRLSFDSHPQLETAFQDEYAVKALRLVRVGFVTFVLGLCVLGVYDTMFTSVTSPWNEWEAWALRSSALLIGVGVVVASYWKTTAFCRWQQLIVCVCWSLMAAFQIIITVCCYAAGAGVYGMSIMLILITTTSFFVGLQFRSVCASIVCLLMVYLVAEITSNSIKLSVCFLVASAALSMLSAHSSEKIQRQDFIRYLRLNNEERKTREILDNMLPKGVMTDIVRSQLLGAGLGGSIIAHEIQVASVLFCDIVSFTTIASSSSPEDVVAILNIMFSTFDALTTKHKGNSARHPPPHPKAFHMHTSALRVSHSLMISLPSAAFVLHSVQG